MVLLLWSILIQFSSVLQAETVVNGKPFHQSQRNPLDAGFFKELFHGASLRMPVQKIEIRLFVVSNSVMAVRGRVIAK